MAALFLFGMLCTFWLGLHIGAKHGAKNADYLLPGTWRRIEPPEPVIEAGPYRTAPQLVATTQDVPQRDTLVAAAPTTPNDTVPNDARSPEAMLAEFSKLKLDLSIIDEQIEGLGVAMARATNIGVEPDVDITPVAASRKVLIAEREAIRGKLHALKQRFLDSLNLGPDDDDDKKAMRTS